MALVALTDTDEVRVAFEWLIARTVQGGIPYERTLGWQGGNQTGIVFWHPAEQIWVRSRLWDNRYWFA